MLVGRTLTGMTAEQVAAQPKPPPSQSYNPMGVGWPSFQPAASQPARATSGPSPDMSAYAPGRAQPTQTQSQGTPYARYAHGTTPEYMAQNPDVLTARPTQPQSQGTPYGQPAQQPANPYANMEPGVYQNGQRIQGDMTAAINTAMQRNAATAHLYNQAQAPYSFFGNAMGMDLGAPQNDPQAMFRQAQEMVNAGWQNPLQRYFDEADTAQRLAQQAPPTMYQPSGPANPYTGAIPFGNDSLPPPVQRTGFEPSILIQQGGSDQRRSTQPVPQRPAPRPISQPSILVEAPPRTPEEAARRDYDNQMNAAFERQRGPVASNPYATPVNRDGRMYEAAPRKDDPNYALYRNYMTEQAAQEQAQYRQFRDQYEARNPFGRR